MSIVTRGWDRPSGAQLSGGVLVTHGYGDFIQSFFIPLSMRRSSIVERYQDPKQLITKRPEKEV